MRAMSTLIGAALALTLITGCSKQPTRLHDAAASGDTTLVASLLANGADVNAKVDGVTALMAAAVTGQTEAARMLIEHGADPNVIGPLGNTALMGAVGRNHVATAGALIAAGANVNAKDVDGSTPLMIAASNGFEDLVPVLLTAGADESATDSNGRTALQWASEFGHGSIVEALRAAASRNGAQVGPADQATSPTGQVAVPTGLSNYAALKVYDDRKNRLQFRYPAEWHAYLPEEVREKTRGLLRPDKDTAVFLINDNNADLNVNVQIFPAPGKQSMTASEFTELAKQLDQTLPGQMPGFGKITQAIVDISGVEALEYVFGSKRGDTEMRQKQVTLVKMERALVVTFTAPAVHFDEAEAGCFRPLLATLILE